MRINEVITESEQLDEISAMDIARGVGKAGGKAIHAASGVAGGLAGAWDAAKSGFQSGRAFVGGQRVGGGAAPRGGSAAGTGRTITYPQVVDAIPNMNADELKNLKQKIDTALQAPSDQSSAAAPAAQSNQGSAAAQSNPTKAQKGMWTDINGKKYMFAGQQWVDEREAIAKGEDLKQIKAKLAAGEIPPPSAERPPEFGGKAAGAAPAQAGAGPVPDVKKIVQSFSKLNPQQIETIRNMLNAKAQGQQNVAEGVGSAIKAGWNKLKNLGGLSFDAIVKAIEQMTPEQAKGLLSQLPAPAASSGQGLPGLTAPTLQPKDQGYVTTKMGGAGTAGSVTTGGVRPAQAGAAQPAAKAPAAAQPATAPNQYGQLTPDEQKFVAAREREGLEPDQIQAALANRRTRQKKPAGAPKAGPKTYLPPEKSQAKRTTDYDWYGAGGVNPSTKLSDLGPVGAAAKRTAAKEGFYSKFLGKSI